MAAEGVSRPSADFYTEPNRKASAGFIWNWIGKVFSRRRPQKAYRLVQIGKSVTPFRAKSRFCERSPTPAGLRLYSVWASINLYKILRFSDFPCFMPRRRPRPPAAFAGSAAILPPPAAIVRGANGCTSSTNGCTSSTNGCASSTNGCTSSTNGCASSMNGCYSSSTSDISPKNAAILASVAIIRMIDSIG